MGKRSFSHLSPRLWNVLPRDVRVIPNLDNFKSSLKHYLFDEFQQYIQRSFPYTSTRIVDSELVNLSEDALNFDLHDYH